MNNKRSRSKDNELPELGTEHKGNMLLYEYSIDSNTNTYNRGF